MLVIPPVIAQPIEAINLSKPDIKRAIMYLENLPEMGGV